MKHRTARILFHFVYGEHSLIKNTTPWFEYVVPPINFKRHTSVMIIIILISVDNLYFYSTCIDNISVALAFGATTCFLIRYINIRSMQVKKNEPIICYIFQESKIRVLKMALFKSFRHVVFTYCGVVASHHSPPDEDQALKLICDSVITITTLRNEWDSISDAASRFPLFDHCWSPDPRLSPSPPLPLKQVKQHYHR